MESARTGPHYADGHGDRFFGQADGASVNSCAITSGSLAISWWEPRVLDGVLDGPRRMQPERSVAGQHLPTNPDELVRQRRDDDGPMTPAIELLQPGAKGGPIPLHPEVRRYSAL